MAIPALPSVLNAGDTITNAWVDAVRALLAHVRDDAPLFKCQSQTNTMTDGAFSVVRFSDGTGGFVQTPTHNVGGFTATVAAGSGYGVRVPEAGVYEVTANVEFTADATVSRRAVRIFAAGSAIAGAEMFCGAAASASNVSHAQSTVYTALLAANDEIHVEAFQDSGNNLTCEDSWISIRWINSATS